MIKRMMFLLVATLTAVLMAACQTISQDTGRPVANPELKIEASPVEQGEDSWKIANSEKVVVTVYAAGARSARILYRPIVETNRHVLLKTITNAGDSGRFSSELKLVPDFAGDVWAEISYPDGTSKETDPIQLAARTSTIAQSTQPGAAGADSSSNRNASVDTTESAQSDKLTGGKIEKSALQPGQPDIKITVNVPAFRLTLWQNGKEVRTYEIGVGMKKYPIVIGERKVTQVIWNPEWVPPDSEWVTESHSDVEPGEHVDAGDSRNPLGKLKIPLGDGFLIHQSARRSDLGHLVSHGCIRMLQEDISDLANKIVTARALNITPAQIDHAMKTTDRLVATLKPHVVVDINYDTLVVEGGVLHIYPDVYGKDANTTVNLRAELQSVGVDVARLDDVTLKQMLDRANMNEEFKVNIADIRSGNALAVGSNQPLTSQSVVAKKQPAKGKSRPGGRGRR
jgi:lipoprotein-anchoring transpeptidase ErfK/SrfK